MASSSRSKTDIVGEIQETSHKLETVKDIINKLESEVASYKETARLLELDLKSLWKEYIGVLEEANYRLEQEVTLLKGGETDMEVTKQDVRKEEAFIQKKLDEVSAMEVSKEDVRKVVQKEDLRKESQKEEAFIQKKLDEVAAKEDVRIVVQEEDLRKESQKEETFIQKKLDEVAAKEVTKEDVRIVVQKEEDLRKESQKEETFIRKKIEKKKEKGKEVVEVIQREKEAIEEAAWLAASSFTTPMYISSSSQRRKKMTVTGQQRSQSQPQVIAQSQAKDKKQASEVAQSVKTMVEAVTGEVEAQSVKSEVEAVRGEVETYLRRCNYLVKLELEVVELSDESDEVKEACKNRLLDNERCMVASGMSVMEAANNGDLEGRLEGLKAGIMEFEKLIEKAEGEIRTKKNKET